VALNDYDKAIQPDISKIKTNVSKLDSQIQQNKEFIAEVQGLSTDISKPHS